MHTDTEKKETTESDDYFYSAEDNDDSESQSETESEAELETESELEIVRCNCISAFKKAARCPCRNAKTLCNTDCRKGNIKCANK